MMTSTKTPWRRTWTSWPQGPSRQLNSWKRTTGEVKSALGASLLKWATDDLKSWSSAHRSPLVRSISLWAVSPIFYYFCTDPINDIGFTARAKRGIATARANMAFHEGVHYWEVTCPIRCSSLCKCFLSFSEYCCSHLRKWAQSHSWCGDWLVPSFLIGYLIL